MKIRNIAGSLKQWYVNSWSTRKEPQGIHIADSVDLQPDLLSTLSKSNFIIHNINTSKGYHEFHSLNSYNLFKSIIDVLALIALI